MRVSGFIYRPSNIKAQINSNIVSNLEGEILNSNETWIPGDVNINLTKTNPLPFLPSTHFKPSAILDYVNLSLASPDLHLEPVWIT